MREASSRDKIKPLIALSCDFGAVATIRTEGHIWDGLTKEDFPIYWHTAYAWYYSHTLSIETLSSRCWFNDLILYLNCCIFIFVLWKWTYLRKKNVQLWNWCYLYFFPRWLFPCSWKLIQALSIWKADIIFNSSQNALSVSQEAIRGEQASVEFRRELESVL